MHCITLLYINAMCLLHSHLLLHLELSLVAHCLLRLPAVCLLHLLTSSQSSIPCLHCIYSSLPLPATTMPLEKISDTNWFYGFIPKQNGLSMAFTMSHGISSKQGGRIRFVPSWLQAWCTTGSSAHQAHPCTEYQWQTVLAFDWCLSTICGHCGPYFGKYATHPMVSRWMDYLYPSVPLHYKYRDMLGLPLDTKTMTPIWLQHNGWCQSQFTRGITWHYR